ncbi:MAG: hypothetical protein PHN41_00935 [Bacteroidales bacterium]|nr:hypothetical protein [Bacteroidales bacterium]
MKIIQKHIKLILSTLIIVLVLSSCASNKRTTMKPRNKKKCNCPTFSINTLQLTKDISSTYFV